MKENTKPILLFICLGLALAVLVGGMVYELWDPHL